MLLNRLRQILWRRQFLHALLLLVGLAALREARFREGKAPADPSFSAVTDAAGAESASVSDRLFGENTDVRDARGDEPSEQMREFTILVDDRPCGQCLLTIRRESDESIVIRCETEVRVKVLGLTMYRYSSRNVEARPVGIAEEHGRLQR
jgi:hypothetical protein